MPEIVFQNRSLQDFTPGDFQGFACMITDPPYSPHVHANAVSANSNGDGYTERDFGFKPLTPELCHFTCMVVGVMSRWSVIFSDLEGTALWREQAKRSVQYIRQIYSIDADPEPFELPWIRWSQPQKSGDRPGAQAEAVLHFHAPRAKHWNGPGSLTHYSRRSLRGDDKHPAQKPLDLMLDLVSWYSDPGESVLDPFAGAGTTALACEILGRDCMALELDPKWAPVFEARRGLAVERDRARAAEWCDWIEVEAKACLAKPRTKTRDGARFTDEKTRERAERRLADAGRVRAWLT